MLWTAVSLRSAMHASTLYSLQSNLFGNGRAAWGRIVRKRTVAVITVVVVAVIVAVHVAVAVAVLVAVAGDIAP